MMHTDDFPTALQQRVESAGFCPFGGKLAMGSAVHSAAKGKDEMTGTCQDSKAAGRRTCTQSGRSLLSSASHLRGGMQIFIKTITNRRFTLDAESSDSISDLKHKITAKTGIPISQQNLIFSNTKLEDSRTLSDYFIEKETTLYLMLGSQRCVIPVIVRTADGKKVFVDVEKAGSVEDLKVQIRDAEGVPVEQQTLVFAGKRLQDEKSLADYNMQREATVYLVVTPKSVIQILVKLEEAEETLTLDVCKSDRVETVKGKIEERKGIKKGAQVLLFNGRRLDDNSGLGECGIDQGALLCLQWSQASGSKGFGIPKETTQQVQ